MHLRLQITETSLFCSFNLIIGFIEMHALLNFWTGKATAEKKDCEAVGKNSTWDFIHFPAQFWDETAETTKFASHVWLLYNYL